MKTELNEIGNKVSLLLDALLALDDRGDHKYNCECDQLCKISNKLFEVRCELYIYAREISNEA